MHKSTDTVLLSATFSLSVRANSLAHILSSILPVRCTVFLQTFPSNSLISVCVCVILSLFLGPWLIYIHCSFFFGFPNTEFCIFPNEDHINSVTKTSEQLL